MAQIYSIRTTTTPGEWLVTSADGCVVIRIQRRKPVPAIRVHALEHLAAMLGEPIECHPELWRPLVNPGPLPYDEMDNTIPVYRRC